MKKFIIALLCLLLVLPLNVFAEEAENQPAAQSEGQSQSENQNSEQSGNQNSDQSGNQNPDQPGNQNSDQSGNQNPDQSGNQNPDQSGNQNPDQSGDKNPDQSDDKDSDQSGSKPEESKPSESKPEESKPQESTPSESKPAETVPSDHKHVWDVSATVPATCVEDGATAYGCSACGAITYEVLPKTGHKTNSQWSRNASGHWHACSVCGEKCDFGNHYPGPAATEEKAQICLTCGYTLTAKLGHSHKYETKWTSDESGHWYACTGCDDQKDFAEHTFDDGCDPDCNICGYASATAHTYSGTWLSDETGHWDVCTNCQEKSPVEPHIPGEEATDTQAQLCLACSFELAPALVPTEHVHQGEGAWLTDAENHWKACTCGEETEKQPHNWDEGEEQEDSTVLYTCEDCGATRTEGEAKNEGSNSILIWMGVAIVALLGAAAAIAFLVLPKVSKGGKYGK